MRRWALCLVAMFVCALVTQSQAIAASGNSQSGIRTGGTRAATPNAAPRSTFSRHGFAGDGVAGRGIPGRYPTLDGARRTFRSYDRFRGGLYGGVTGFVPLPTLYGLPYYDGFETPYFFPDTAGPYIDEIYGFPPAYLPPDGGYGLPPQTDYLPPTSPDGAAGAAGPQVWYYCRDPMGYYPYVRDCNIGWQAVPASVLPSPTPQ